MAEVQSVMILINNLEQLIEADPSGLRDRKIWFMNQIEVMFGFLLDYYSEEGSRSDHHHHHRHLAGASSDDEMRRVVGMIRNFAVNSGDVLVDAFEEIIAKQHTNSTNITTEDENDESLACNDNPAAAINPDIYEQVESIVSHIYTYNSRDYYCRIVDENVELESLRVSPSNRSNRTLDENDATGFYFYMYMMAKRLSEEKGIQQLEVIAITGEGGTGKTTLAKMIYHSLTDTFGCCGWIPVSKAYVLRDLLLSLLKEIMAITQEIHEMDERELKIQLWKELKDRRYLIVIDDVWDTQTWDELKDLFPINSNYSRILLTTRFSSLASYATRPGTRSFPLPEDFFGVDSNDLFLYYYYRFDSKKIWPCNCFELKSLNEDQSWMLFCRLYFRKECPCDELEARGRRIVRSCCGRLLVISVVAHILRAIDRVDGSSWSSIAGQINDEPSGDYDQQMHILTLCFRKLRQPLQSCFLYLGGLFPEDAEIYLEQLIQIWIAEALVVFPMAPITIEEVAEYYLEELNGLRLIEVSRQRSDGRAKSCFIHDILRDFCLHLSKEQGFLEVHTGRDHTNTSSAGADQIKPKILSILGNCRVYLFKAKSSSDSCSPVRSFSSFSQDTQSFSEEDWRSLFQHFRRLRVLNLGDQEAQDEIDDSIRDLTHLKYLKLKPAKSIPVPIAAIFNLWNLQTIDLRKSSFSELPVEIWKMQQLRHLYLGGNCMLPEAENEDHLPNLLTLSYISNDPDVRVSEKVPNLRKLGLNGYRCESKVEEEATFSLQHLQSLKFAEECTFIETIMLPATITQITVKAAVLQPNVMEMLGKLPKLRTLKLVETNFENDEWKVLQDSFPRLRVLKLANSDIVSWKLEKCAMPRLGQLVISCCSQLSELPSEVYRNRAFHDLELVWPSTKLTNKLAEELKKLKIGFELVIYPPIPKISDLLIDTVIDGDLLDINPTQIRFPFELNTQSSCSIELANNTNQFVAFQLLSANWEKYLVTLYEGIVLPRSTCDLTFTLQAQKEAPINMESKDEFLIQSLVAPHGTTAEDITPDMFNHELGKAVNQFKLPVIYVLANPPQPVPEDFSPGACVLEKPLSAGTTGRDLLEIKPTELESPFKLESSCSMQLTNNTDQLVAFVLRTTKSETYFGHPVMGIVLPGSTCDVIVKLHAHMHPFYNEERDSVFVNVVAVPLGTTAEDITLDMFDGKPGEVMNVFELPVTYACPTPRSPGIEGPYQF